MIIKNIGMLIMKRKYEKIKSIQIIVILLLFVNSFIQAQDKNDCKYSKNTIDEFTKKADVRTKPQEIAYEKRIAPPETPGGLWCKKTIEVSACNINGNNHLLLTISNCNCGYDDVTFISLLLENGEVIILNNKTEMEIKGDCANFWQFYSAGDSTWLKLKTIPLKKIRVFYSGNR